MTEFESNCYGMTEADIREEYINSLTGRLTGQEMVVMSILSDCQELLSMTTGTGTAPYASESVRKQLNIAKFILSEMMDAKRA